MNKNFVLISFRFATHKAHSVKGELLDYDMGRDFQAHKVWTHLALYILKASSTDIPFLVAFVHLTSAAAIEGITAIHLSKSTRKTNYTINVSKDVTARAYDHTLEC